MKYTASSFILIATLALAACEVGPDYEQSKLTTPTLWDANAQQAPMGTVDAAWWQQFHDPILTQLIEKASANNLDLQVAETRILESRAKAEAAGAALWPTGDVKANAMREANMSPLPPSAGSFADLIKKPFNVFQTGFDASWELDLFGGTRRAEEAAKATLQAAEASRDDALISLRAEVARDYIALREVQAEVAIARDQIAADSKARSIAAELFKAGQSPSLDVTVAAAHLQQSEQQLPPLRAAVAENAYKLDVLLGETPGFTRKLVDAPAPIPEAPSQIVLTAPAEVIAQRPDIRAAERRVAAATAQQGVATAKFYPDISLNGFFGLLSTSADTLMTGGSEAWSMGGGVLWPILNIGTLSANLDETKAEQKEALITYRKTVLTALADVETALASYNEEQQALQAASQQSSENHHAVAIAAERYKAGITSYGDVLTADQTLYDAQMSQVKARAMASADLVALYKSLGGGWQQK